MNTVRRGVTKLISRSYSSGGHKAVKDPFDGKPLPIQFTPGVTATSTRTIPKKILEKREIYQADDGLPMYLKGGPAKVLLYRVTFGLSLAGNAYALLVILPAMLSR